MTRRVSDMTPEQRAAHREQRREEARRYRARVNADPEKRAKWLAQKREEGKRWAAKVRANPSRREAFHARVVENARKRRAKLKAENPAAHAAWLESERRSYHERRRDPIKRAALLATWRRADRRAARKKARALIARVKAALPASLPPFVIEEIAQNMLLAIAERKLKRDDIETRAAEFVRSHNRQFDRFKTLSLDAPIPGMNGMTYLDRLAAQ